MWKSSACSGCCPSPTRLTSSYQPRGCGGWSASLDNVDTLVQHPVSMTHRPMFEEDRLAVEITNGMIRISAGIESAKHIIADFARAISGL